MAKDMTSGFCGACVAVVDRIRTWHIVVAAAVIYAMALTTTLSLNGDDATFILTARLFLEKGLVTTIIFTDYLVKAYYYILLPVLLMPFQLIAPDNFLFMKVIPVTATVLSIIVLSLLLRGEVGDRERKAILVLYAFNPWVVEYAGLIMTDALYIFLSLSTLLCLKMYLAHRGGRYLILSALGAGLSMYARGFGLALWMGMVVFLAVSQKWRACLALALIVIVMCLPLLITAGPLLERFTDQFVGKRDYFAVEYQRASPAQRVYRAGRTLLVYIGNYLPDLLARPLVEPIAPRLPGRTINPAFLLKCMFGLAAALCIVAGFVRTARYHFGAYHVYLLLHLAANLSINVYVARYLFSLLPFLLFFFCEGMATWQRPVARGVVIFFAALAFLGTVSQIAIARSGRLPDAAACFVACNTWVREHTSPTAHVLSRKPGYTEVLTGRHATGYIFTDDADAQLRHMRENGVTHVIVGDLGSYLHEGEAVHAAIRQDSSHFTLLYTPGNDPACSVYEVRR